ncbi:DNA-binding CsgD family transcriptional regulator [Kibdelosporangium banguiense]|uniref:DNA-binding CsgD family transcriptional regulator n=1 Tax=Kibdelosporangium banguiense TaxID=1365924 RepID=A0ABS4TZ20_9PSEU|nr:helix-turn-helix transcriptional regulator [Kibdelosporangium banguiense]MBP2329156.1 DNA-binding CsgD family transcriptional regulator [Kibdelosporangium banguiense]
MSVDATREVLVTCAVTTANADRWFDTIDRVAPANLRRGVQYRVVFPDHARHTLKERVAGLVELGAHVRTVPAVPLNAMVIDGVRAVLPTTQGSPADGAAVSIENVVAAAIGVFEHLWQTGTPFSSRDAPDKVRLSRRERKVLKMLEAGYPDESIAVRLGVSVRTVRRMISAMMDRLGARSRFQAGARAADLGWLNDDDPL